MSNEGTSAESDVTDEMQYAFDGCVFSKMREGLPMSHLSPVFPEEQRHLPDTGSH